MTDKFKKLKAFCHCGSIRLNIFLDEPIAEIIRCNCSICSKSKGFGMLCVPKDKVSVVEGFQSVTEYVFNSNEAPHSFLYNMWHAYPP